MTNGQIETSKNKKTNNTVTAKNKHTTVKVKNDFVAGKANEVDSSGDIS